MVLVLLFLLLFVPGSGLLAQHADSATVKRFRIFPLPAIGYAPETRWYFGAVALMNLRLDSLHKKTSNVELEFNYTQNKQFIYTENHELRIKEGRLLLYGSNGYYRFPEYYWQNPEYDSTRFRYDADRLEIDNAILIKWGLGPHLGLRQRYHYMKIEDGASQIPATGNKTRMKVSGMGPQVIYDTRDHVLNARRGVYGSVSMLFFVRGLGSNYVFSNLGSDFRYYYPIRKKSVVALQLTSNFNWGNVPFRMAALAGSEAMLRGYYQGQYRSSHLVAVQSEYRLNIWNWLGATAFAGWGKSFSNSGNVNHSLPGIGGGIRIRMDKKDNINLRFDYGIGKNSTGFYVAFGEAF